MNNELTRLRKRRASLDRAIEALEQLEKLVTSGTPSERMAGRPQPEKKRVLAPEQGSSSSPAGATVSRLKPRRPGTSGESTENQPAKS